jgi:hypothetical protein
MELIFPFRGINRGSLKSAQPQGSAYSIINALPIDSISGRIRGGQRGGLVNLAEIGLSLGSQILSGLDCLEDVSWSADGKSLTVPDASGVDTDCVLVIEPTAQSKQTITVGVGWFNWISFNVLPAVPTVENVLADYAANNNDRIVTQGHSSTYYDVEVFTGWDPSININHSVRYALYSAEGDTFSLEGDGAYSVSITVYIGSTWIGYPFFRQHSLADIFKNFQLSDGDYIEDVDGVKCYFDGTDWGDNEGDLDYGVGKGALLSCQTAQTAMFYDPDFPAGKSDKNVVYTVESVAGNTITLDRAAPAGEYNAIEFKLYDGFTTNPVRRLGILRHIQEVISE